MKMFNSLFLLLCVAFGCSQGDANAYLKVGDPIPPFSYESSLGVDEEVKSHQGDVILINLFATWCPPCRAELPHVQTEIWERYGANDNFTMLTFGREHSWTEISKFAEENSFTFPIYADPERKVFSNFAKQSIPRCILFGKDGRLITQTVGFNEDDFSDLVEAISTALK